MAKKLAAGNWKMNGTRDSLREIEALNNAIADVAIDVLICPPATLIASMPSGKVMAGAQDCHAKPSGAHTGDLSPEILADAGAKFVIVGHSERRADHGETDGQVCEKADAAQRAGLTPIVCVGETLAEREAGETLTVIATQLSGSLPASLPLVVAYEPVWAIGTGKVPTLAQIAEVHAAIRAQLTEKYGTDDISILYGGSVKPDNAAEIFAVEHVDGALVGGASLKADDFLQIVNALDA